MILNIIIKRIPATIIWYMIGKAGTLT